MPLIGLLIVHLCLVVGGVDGIEQHALSVRIFAS